MSNLVWEKTKKAKIRGNLLDFGKKIRSRFRKRRRKGPYLEKKVETSGWFQPYWWDLLGLFGPTVSEKSSDFEENSSFSILDPLGLFSTSKSSSTSDQNTFSFFDPLGLFSTPVSENSDDYEYYYLYDDYSDIKLVKGLDSWVFFTKESLG